MTSKESSLFLVCLSLLLLPSVKGKGLLSIEDLQYNAVFLSRYTSHDFQWEFFPYISISCDCSITSWTFIATEQLSISNGQGIQFQLWTPIDNNTDTSFSLVESIEVEIRQVERLYPVNLFGMSLLRFTMDPSIEVTGNTMFGIFQPPSAESNLIFQYQSGRAPDNYQRPNTQPDNMFVTTQTIRNNDYPLVAVEHSCSDKCISGFLGTEGLQRFFIENLNVHLVNYRGYNRLLPALNFTCSTTITSITVGASRVFGGGTPEIQTWRPQVGRPGRFSGPVHRISLAEMITAENPGVYQYILMDSLPVEEGDIVSVYETMISSLSLHNEKDAGLYPLNILNDESTLSQDNDWPLLSIETGDDGCTAGFMTSSDLVRKSISLAFSTNFIFNYACVVPDVQFPRDGLLSKAAFVGQFLQSSPDSKLYPELQIWRVQGNSNNDTYVKVTTTNTTSVLQFTGHLNVYEFTFDPPVEVKESYVLGYYQPPSAKSRLGLVTIQDRGPENYCIFGQNPDTFSTQSSAVASLVCTPLVTFEYDVDECSGTCVENARCLYNEGSYTCVCASGYTGDGYSRCVENGDDECADSCVENANCLDIGGNYSCVCASGYTGDGYSSCVGVEGSGKTLFVGVGVALAVLALIATAVTIIIVLARLRKKKKHIITENVAYLSNTQSSSLNSNSAYIETDDQGPPISTNTNEAYTVFTSINEAYGIASTTNEENDTFINEAYEALDVPTSPNQAHQAAEYSDASNSFTNDYTYDYIPHTT